MGTGLGAGLLLTAGLPPFGWWPLALVGMAVLAAALAGARARRRVEVGVAAGIGLLAPGLFWMSEFSAPGYVLAVLIEVTLLTIGVAVVPPGRGRLLGLPAALVLAEALRGIWPFGGVPIATVAQTQIGGPLSLAARAGGAMLVTAVVAVAGVALWALATRRPRAAALAALLCVAAAVVGAVASDGRAVGPLDVAIVQGGGERGLLASDAGDAEVLAAHLETSGQLPAGLDLVVWPENVVTVKQPVATTRQADQLAGVARDSGATSSPAWWSARATGSATLPSPGRPTGTSWPATRRTSGSPSASTCRCGA
jgi:apolipoprotein N-acyltransferase